MDYKDLDDKELAHLSRSGDMDAFEEIVFRYEKKLFFFIISLGCSNSEAEDVLQNSFIKIFNKISTFNPDLKLQTWLYAVTRNTAYDLLRKRKDTIPFEDIGNNIEMPETREKQEKSEELWYYAKRCLNGEQYQAIWLKYSEGMKISDIAEVLDKSTNAVKVLMHRGKKLLKQALCSCEENLNEM